MKNDEVDALLTEASNTSDEEARCVAFKAAQKILEDNAVALYGVNTPSFYAMNNTVKGFRLVEPVGIRFIANDIYLEK